MSEKRTCSKCSYFVPGSSDNWGNCHYNPPVIPKPGTSDRWPPCRKEESCGKWLSSYV